MSATISEIKAYFLGLQKQICTALEAEETSGVRFCEDAWENSKLGGGGSACVMQDGAVFEKAGVNFSHVKGDSLPKAATAKRPDLVGASFEALGVSLVIHPYNPFVPTSHANVRFFQAKKPNGEIVWWFGGGYDLTPYYGFEDDCVHWHQTAKSACDAVDSSFYPRFKVWADDYFYLKHREECRGIGGLFFDDLNERSFDECFQFVKNVGDTFIEAYVPIVNKRKHHAFDESHRAFQAYRRGRYVEFNLVFDRGTLFGLQFGGRTESILMSLPPKVEWKYNWHPIEGTPEHRLTDYFLKPRNWLSL